MRAMWLCLALVSAGGCAKKDDGPNGVGPWNFKLSKLKDAKVAGRCLPPGEGGFVQCIGLTAMQVGGQQAETTLYFKGDSDDAPLVEISLSVRACEAPAVTADLTSRIGEPREARLGGKMLFWSMPGMFVRAEVPEKGSAECIVTFVSPRDTARIDDLQKGS